MMQIVGPSLLILLLIVFGYFALLGYRARDFSMSQLLVLPVTCVWTFCFLGILLFGESRDAVGPETFSLWTVAAAYLMYALGAIAAMHVFLWCFAAYREAEARPITKDYPRYLDYGYAVVMAIGFGQIFIFTTELARYYDSRLEPEQDIVRDARDLAQTIVTKDCSGSRTKYITDEYCDKVSKIAATPIDQLKQVLLTSFINDRAFLTHVTGTGRAMTYSFAGSGSREVELRNPLAEPLSKLKVREDYQTIKTNDETKATIGWLGLLILPWGIGLRVVKTSMELFLNLVDPPKRESLITVLPRLMTERMGQERPPQPSTVRPDEENARLAQLPKGSAQSPSGTMSTRPTGQNMIEDAVALGGLLILSIWTYIVLPFVVYHH